MINAQTKWEVEFKISRTEWTVCAHLIEYVILWAQEKTKEISENLNGPKLRRFSSTEGIHLIEIFQFKFQMKNAVFNGSMTWSKVLENIEIEKKN